MNPNKNVIYKTFKLGFSQLIVLIFSVLRTKAIAIFFGVNGIGLFTVFQNFQQLVASIFSFGMPIVGVKDMSNLNTGDTYKLKIYAFKFVLLNSILSFGVTIFLLLVTLIFKLDDTFFRDKISAICVSLSVGLLLVYNGLIAVFQSIGRINTIAKSMVFGNFLGFAFSLPLFYLLGYYSISLSLLIQAVISVSTILFFDFKGIKTNYNLHRCKIRELITFSKKIFRKGIFYALTAGIGLLVPFILRAFVYNQGSLTDLGYFGALYQVTFSYTGIMFTVMGTEFFPRISAISKKYNLEISDASNNQIYLTLLVIIPLMFIFLVFNKTIITYLFSNQFLHINNYSMIAGIINLLKAVSWVLAYVYMTKFNPKNYLVLEILSGLISIFLGVILYRYFDFLGLVISLILSNLMYLLILIFLLKRDDFLKLSNGNLTLLLGSILIYISLLLFNSYGFQKIFFLLAILSVVLVVILLIRYLHLNLKNEY